ncbi:Bcr/CflA family efflux MFS transporter [Aquincola tertiaricarbonis]|uniref:Bcr/CflA family efflux transporter n=1 Tax=Aquincola tertiaricarbonis TaxID=391953 RepID=A0ABY4SEA8_AQUTE|nr:Bcr/CflA family efflux MFS transporter [Aquincola tertiaricarbonis]URI11656.1 Bcr/CflA family efflux MFS transporter [Aquincola tertiaricarbonis]
MSESTARPNAGTGRAARMAPAVAATLLALLLGLQPLSTDLYLPALPALARGLGAGMPAVQLTMSALILAFGVAQLFWGPVADRYGRRPVLRVAMALFAVASLGATLAPSIEVLTLWRAAQGACLAAAVVCARAMVRDLYEPAEGARVMSLAMSGLGVIALSSPMVGGLLAASFGWRSTLLAVTLVVTGVLLFVWRVLPETARSLNPQALHAGTLARTARRVASDPTFFSWASLTACTYGGLFVVLASSSFVYIEVLGLSAAQYGMALGAGSTSYVAGTFACRRLLRRHGLTGTVQRGAFFSLAGGLGMAALAAGGVHAVAAVLVPQCLYAFGHGIHQPCGQTGAVSPFPQAAGVAAALAGFALALVAFCVGLWLGQALDGTVRPMAYGLAFWAVLTAGVAWTLVPRHGALRAA